MKEREDRYAPDLENAENDDIYYALTMFPYPSGIGLHCGHASIFTINDVVARFQRMQGKYVFNPFGFDAFGLPAENYAMKVGKPAYEVIEENKATFMKQIKALELSFDWTRMVDTSKPDYYKWTQWIFQQLFKAWLVYRDVLWVNRCPDCQTVLANDQVVNGKCERCKDEVTQKKMPQWFIKITDYADRLIEDLDTIDRPEETKTAQRNWIGRSEWAEIDFTIEGTEKKITCFTTRPDTIYGVTGMVLAPENTILDEIMDEEYAQQVDEYRRVSLAKTAVERQQDVKEKTWVFSGIYALHPLTNTKIPIWFADYVLADYGSGAVMMVPAHDERDYAFAEKFGMEIKQVIDGEVKEWATLVREGVLMNSWTFDGLDYQEAKEKIIEHLASLGKGKKSITYKLRDRSVSRQRYWGSPIPVYYVPGTVTGEVMDTEKFATLVKMSHELDTIAKDAWGELIVAGWFSVSLYAWYQYRNHDDLDCTYNGPNREWFLTLMKENDYVHTWSHKKWLGTYETFEKEGIEVEIATMEQTHLIWESDIEDLHIGSQKISSWLTICDLKTLIQMKTYLSAKRNKPKDLFDLNVLEWEDIRPLVQDVPHLVSEEELPVVLPLDVKNYKPKWKSPLEEHPTFPVYEKEGKKYKRECDTLDTFMCSSFYFLRYPDANNPDELIRRELANKLFPIDFYSGGKEHTVGHLLYSRFIHKFLYDQGYVATPEPFGKLVHQGMVLWADGRKMSKRYNNWVDPMEVIETYWADAVRTYLMFMGPVEQDKTWNDNALNGVKKFLDRVERLLTMERRGEENETVTSVMHQTIKWVTQDIEKLKLNTAVSKLMIFVNTIYDEQSVTTEQLKALTLLLAPYAPVLAERMRELLGHYDDVHHASWPVYDESKIQLGLINLPVQINGKMRGSLDVEAGLDEDAVLALAQSMANVNKWLEDKEIVKVIYVQDKILNIVVK